MDWSNWQTYAAPAIVLITVFGFVGRWKKANDAKCCGGRCGCSVSQKKKKNGSVFPTN
jgi:hypothetical protein